MNVFDLDRAFADRYAKLSRSFSPSRALDTSKRISDVYQAERFWPEEVSASELAYGMRSDRARFSVKNASIYCTLDFFGLNTDPFVRRQQDPQDVLANDTEIIHLTQNSLSSFGRKK